MFATGLFGFFPGVSLTRIMRAIRSEPHAWTESAGEHCDIRTCTICGRIEEQEIGGGSMGSMWYLVDGGDKTAHAK